MCGHRWAQMLANVWPHYWSNLNGIYYQRVTHTHPEFMQTHSQIVSIIIMAKDE